MYLALNVRRELMQTPLTVRLLAYLAETISVIVTLKARVMI